MNREIKFRGMRVDNGEWGYGYYYQSYCQMNLHGDEKLLHWIQPFCEDCELVTPESRHEVDPATRGEFTGLLDKEGVEIYEGDICQHDKHSNLRSVYYSRGAFRSTYGKLDTFGILSNQPNDELIVIGNVHDNPELIEGEE